MATKIIWTGMFLMLAVGLLLESVGLAASGPWVVVGAIIFFIGLLMLWMDR